MAAGSRRRGGGTGESGGAGGGGAARRGRGGGVRGRNRASSSASRLLDDDGDGDCAPALAEEAWLEEGEEEEELELDGNGEPPPPAPPAPPPVGPPPQAFALTAAPMYPNSCKWSEENLLAVAAGHMVTILNPAALSGPRSFVAVPPRPTFDFGTINREDLRNHLLLPLTLSRDSRAVVRCIDWSPQGVASNGGCLLAVGTTDFRVKLYVPPLGEYRSEWLEVADVSEIMLAYCIKYEFLEGDGFEGESPSSVGGATGRTHRKRHAPEQLSPMINVDDPSEDPLLKRRRTTNNGISPGLSLQTGNTSMMPMQRLWDSNHGKPVDKPVNVNEVLPEDVVKMIQNAKRGPYDHLQVAGSPSFTPESVKPGRRKKQQKFKDGSGSGILITAAQYMSRSAMLTPLVLSWSPKCYCSASLDGNAEVEDLQCYVYLAVGTKSGLVGFWRILNPEVYSVEKNFQPQHVSFLGFLLSHDSWVTVLEWGKFHDSTNDLLLATGSSDGSVKLWLGDSRVLMNWQPSSHLVPWNLLAQVTALDTIPITSLALKVPSGSSRALLAVGKGSGTLSAWDCTKSGVCTSKASLLRAHDQAVMGLCWTIDGNFFYSCGQDNVLRIWEFSNNELVQAESSLLSSEVPATAPDLPASALESFFGVALSPSNLALAMVRGIAAEVVDPMYQSRSQKGVVQLIWVGGQDDSKVDGFDDVAQSIYAITAGWKPRVTTALSYMEQHAQALVLWDVLTVLAFLKGICGIEILASIFQTWPSSSKFVNTGAPDICCWSTNDLRASLPSMSTRCLQMIVTIYRRIILQDIKFSLLSEGLEAMQNSVTRTQLTAEQQIWLDNLWFIEHELRERLMLLACVTALWWKSAQAENVQPSRDMENRISTALLMSDWVLLNTSKVSPQLVELANEVHKVYKRADASGQYIFQENCSYCGQSVPLDYLEVGYCRADGMGTNFNHRLQRCSASLRICPPGPTWFCSCCARNASQQPPELFFSLPSMLEIERLPSISVLQPVVPKCPFCGILLQRSVPEFFLLPTSV